MTEFLKFSLSVMSSLIAVQFCAVLRIATAGSESTTRARLFTSPLFYIQIPFSFSSVQKLDQINCFPAGFMINRENTTTYLDRSVSDVAVNYSELSNGGRGE